MTASHSHLPVAFVRPGEWHFSDRPTLVKTILGSCIGISMLDRKTGAAAFCHAILPSCDNKKSCSQDRSICFRYVSCSFSQLLERFAAKGIKKNRLEVKIFGGAEVLESLRNDGSRQSVGRQNTDMAMRAIKAENLNLVSSDVGGKFGRKIYFDTESGEIFLKKCKK